ncbi:hypothetical protein [Pseudomonas sp. ESBL1]|uniref:hypothetical protein n=1 Tax=Pseudomonas sp. ESBL1 TaxID=3077324 RepID=UPI002FC8B32D
MAQYEVKTFDGVVHRIEAVTHVLDSNGLTFYANGGVVEAIFPKFEWMRQAQAAVEETATPVEETAGDAGTSSPPVAVGE